MTLRKNVFLSLVASLIFLTAIASSAQIIFEDEFQDHSAWFIADGTGAGLVEVRRLDDVPEGHGPEVLWISGGDITVYAKALPVRDCLIEVLWRDAEPQKDDADGIIVARAQGRGCQRLKATPPEGGGGYWVEHDTDAGFQLKVSVPPSWDMSWGSERMFDGPGEILLNDEHKINVQHPRWLWQTLRMEGARMRASYRPAGASEEAGRIIVIDSTHAEGALGLGVWSGAAEVAYIRVTAIPGGRLPDGPRVFIFPDQTVFPGDTTEFIDLRTWGADDEDQMVRLEICAGDKVLRTQKHPALAFTRIPIDPQGLPEGDIELRAALLRGNSVIHSDAAAVRIIRPQQVLDDLADVETALDSLRREIGATSPNILSHKRVTLTTAENALPLVRRDVRTGKLDRARASADFLQATMASPPRWPTPVDAPSVMELTVKESGYFRGDQPVFLSGVMGWAEPVEDIPKMAGYGFNAVGLEIGPSSTVPGPGVFNPAVVDSLLVPALRSAEDHNVSIMLLLSPHYFPAWAYERYPEVKSCGVGFLAYCIEHPDARKVLETHIRGVAARLKNFPALESYCLANEPQFVERCDLTLTKFRAYLAETYRNIQALNRAWGTSHSAFDAIPLPEEFPEQAAVKYDWHTFRGRQVTGFFRWMKSIIREEDPHRPVHVKFMMDVFQADEGRFGIDRELLGDVTEVIGCDAVTLYPGPGPLGGEFLSQNIFYDLLHSFHPGKPIYNSEYHVIRDADPEHYPGNYIRTAIWEGALHGQSGFTFWVWARHERHHTVINNILLQPEATEAGGHMSVDLTRLAGQFRLLQNVCPKVAVLFSRASKLLSTTYLDETILAYEGLTFHGLAVGFVSERQTLAGKLDDFDLLVIPGADYVPESVFQAVKEFAVQGGRIVLTGDALRFDNHAKSRLEPLRALNAKRHGDAHLVNFPTVAGDTRFSLRIGRDYHRMLARLLPDAGIAPRVEVVGESGGHPWGVESRCTRDGQRLLMSIANWHKQPLLVSLQSRTGISRVRDLITGRGVDPTRLSLESMSPMLLEILPKVEK